MTTTITETETITSIVAESTFLQELILQVRIQDHNGVYRSWADEMVLANYVITEDKKSKISEAKDADAATRLRILSFYWAIASCIEKETGKLCQAVIDFSPGGFGRARVWTGRFIVLSRALQKIQNFGYPSLKRLAFQGKRLVDFGIKTSDLFAITN